ncbi:MAG: WbqC family protein [Bacteroidota bacterium]
MLPSQRTQPSRYYQPVSYPQVFGRAFTPNLSIIDLLCCEGQHATDILRQSAVYA